MDNNKDFMRIEGHPEPPAIQEHYAEPETKAAAAAPATKKASGRKNRKGDRVGDFIWAGIAAVCVLALIGIVYFLSGTPGRQQQESGVMTAYQADEIIEFDTDNQTGAGIITNNSAASPMAVAAVADTVGEAEAVYLFPLDESAIAENAELNALAAKAKKEGAYVSVVAYTDASGSDDYNLALSERRAQSVGNYLVAHGVPADHVTTRGLGETDAYATAALDRRAEVRLN